VLLAEYTRWAVLWVVKRNGKIRLKVKDFGDDFVGATEYYERKRHKPFATLLSKNVGWPPPKKYRPYEEWEIVTRRGKKFKHKVRTVPLDTLNGEGWFWVSLLPQAAALRTGSGVPGVAARGLEVPNLWDPSPRQPRP
jgi:hypothetical protein